MVNFNFEHPEVFWAGLVVLTVLLLATWRSRAQNSRGGRITALILRIAWTAACLLAAAGPILSRTTTRQVPSRVYVLQDASRSVADDSPQAQRLQQALREEIGAGTEIVDLNFAARPWKPSEPLGDTSATDIASALNYANLQSLDAPDVKVVVLSDGRATRGDSVEAADRLALRGASVHTVPIGTHRAAAAHVVRAEPPADAHVGMAASARVTVASEKPVRVQVQLVDSGGNVVDQRVLPVQGQKTMVLHFTPKAQGIEVYSVRVDLVREPAAPTVAADTRPLSVFVKGPPRLLICDNFPAELQALYAAMEPLKVPIDLFSPDNFPSNLAPYAAVVLSDFSGKELTDHQRADLHQFVEQQGGGLVFIGGGNVLPAKWKVNPLAEVFPVMLHDKPAQLVRKTPDASVVYVVDRSGSMRQTLGGAVPVSKMDMVKAAIIVSVQSLPEHTQVGVVSFDNRCTVLVPPTDVSKKEEISRLVDTLKAGGGTVIEPAIREGMALLAQMPGKKYLIVLTDGIGERPAADVAYWGAVADDAKKMHISWTSVAVGADADQALLSYLANETRGQFFFCDTGDKIPKVFLQQAQSIKRVQQQKERPFHPLAGPYADRLKDVTPADMPLLDGRVRATVRDHVDVLLLGEDNEPLLASWQFGLGRVVAFTSDAKAGWAKDWLSWKGYSAFWLQTVQAVMRADPALHAHVASHLVGNSAVFNFKVTDKDGHAADNLKVTGTLAVAPGVPRFPATSQPVLPAVEWKQLGPGEYQASAELPGDGNNYLVSLALEKDQGKRTEYCAIVTAQTDVEMAETGADMAALKAIANAGHGLCSTDVSMIAAACRQTRQQETTQRSPLWRALVIAALLLLPLDIAARKFL